MEPIKALYQGAVVHAALSSSLHCHLRLLLQVSNGLLVPAETFPHPVCRAAICPKRIVCLLAPVSFLNQIDALSRHHIWEPLSSSNAPIAHSLKALSAITSPSSFPTTRSALDENTCRPTSSSQERAGFFGLRQSRVGTPPPSTGRRVQCGLEARGPLLSEVVAASRRHQ